MQMGQATMVNGKRIVSTDMELKNGAMDQCLKDIFRMVKSRDREN